MCAFEIREEGMKLNMKILGEKSLSSKVIVGLKILFAVISILTLIVLSIIAKIIRHITMQESLLSNIFDLSFYIVIMITGLIALLIVYQFIKIFKNLKNNTIFSQSNVKSLNVISNNCFAIAICYFIIVLFAICIIIKVQEVFINYVLYFSIMLMLIFMVAGVGIKVLNEIYKKAIEYKEENDFTI